MGDIDKDFTRNLKLLLGTLNYFRSQNLQKHSKLQQKSPVAYKSYGTFLKLKHNQSFIFFSLKTPVACKSYGEKSGSLQKLRDFSRAGACYTFFFFSDQKLR